MPESKVKEAIYNFFSEMGTNIVEERAVEYIIRELHNGRQLSDILHDPYIKNRFDQGHLEHILENKHLLKAFEENIRETFPLFD